MAQNALLDLRLISNYLGEESRGPNIPAEDKKLDKAVDVADIIRLIEECNGLNTLKLSGNSFGIEACETIGQTLAQVRTLKRLLWSDMFVSRGMDEIPRSLNSLCDGVVTSGSQLVELDLSDNAFGLAGLRSVVNLLTSPAAFTIKVLRFNNNGLGIGGGKALATALENCYIEAQNSGARFALEIFVAGRNRLENSGAMALAAAFKTLGTLVKVSMPQNGITAEGIAALAKAFGANSDLQTIDLNDNTFTAEGANAMAAVLPNLQKLQVLNFGDCLVRADGAVAIAKAIQDGHKSLQELNLSFCELDINAGTAVVNALENKSELKKIDLNGNCFGEEGVEQLRQILESKGHLEVLGSLSDDEGERSDDDRAPEGSEEEEEERDRREEEEGEETASEGDDEGSGHKSPTSHATITVEEYVTHPSGDNLLALGNKRVHIVGSLLGKDPTVEAVAAMYCKVTSCYCEGMPRKTKEAVENTVDRILKQPFQTNSSNILNAIFVQVGLIKSEDKTFKCVKEVDGPLLALEHVIRQDYFSTSAEEILTAFVNKPGPVLEKRAQIRDKLFRALMTL